MEANIVAPVWPALPWWAVLLEGIALLILGLLLLTWPGPSLVVMVQFLGAYWLVSGIFSLVGLFINHSLWGWKLFSGTLGVVAGVLVLRHPLWSAIVVPGTLVVLVAALGILIGIARLVEAFQGGGWETGILGVLSIVLGLILLFNPLIGVAVLPWTLGVLAIAGGVLAIASTFVRPRQGQLR